MGADDSICMVELGEIRDALGNMLGVATGRPEGERRFPDCGYMHSYQVICKCGKTVPRDSHLCPTCGEDSRPGPCFCDKSYG